MTCGLRLVPERHHVQKDRTEGSAAGISSTPTLFINGREYSGTHDTESLREWIKEELAK